MGLASWIRLGKQGAKGFSDNLAINVASNPDYAGLAIAGLNARSSERQTAIAAESKVRQAGMRALGNVKETQIGIDAKEKINDMKVSNFRKAGIIGALGTVAAGGVAAVQNNQAQKRADEREVAEQQRWDDRMAYLRESNANMPKPPEVTPFKWNGGDSGSSSSSDSSGSSSSSSSPLVSSGQAVAAGKGTAGKGGRYSQADMTSFAEQAGFSPEQARIMGAIGFGESGGNAGIDTVQSGLDPNRSNEYSVGLFQINAQAHGDKLAKLGYTSDDLRDPLKNAKVAKMVYDEVGGFTPWSVYTKGIYKDYL